MVWHLKHNRALHERLLVLTVDTEPTPWVTPSKRLAVEEIAPQSWRVRGSEKPGARLDGAASQG
jgi:KUP system potassium uptake protein